MPRDFILATMGDVHFYLDGTSGDDTNDGSSGNPWKTWSRAMSIIGSMVIRHKLWLHVSGTFEEASGEAIAATIRLQGAERGATPDVKVVPQFIIDGGTGRSTVDSKANLVSDINSSGQVGLSTESWSVNEYVGYIVRFDTGAQAGREFLILENSATTISFSNTITTSASDQFSIVRPSTIIKDIELEMTVSGVNLEAETQWAPCVLQQVTLDGYAEFFISGGYWAVNHVILEDSGNQPGLYFSDSKLRLSGQLVNASGTETYTGYHSIGCANPKAAGGFAVLSFDGCTIQWLRAIAQVEYQEIIFDRCTVPAFTACAAWYRMEFYDCKVGGFSGSQNVVGDSGGFAALRYFNCRHDSHSMGMSGVTLKNSSHGVELVNSQMSWSSMPNGSNLSGYGALLYRNSRLMIPDPSGTTLVGTDGEIAHSTNARPWATWAEAWDSNGLYDPATGVSVGRNSGAATWVKGRVTASVGARTYYINGSTGNDAWDGESLAHAVKTFSRLFELLPRYIDHNTVVNLSGSFPSNALNDGFYEVDVRGDAILLFDGGSGRTTVEGPYTATASAVGSLTDSGRAWTVNALVGHMIIMNDGPQAGQIRMIQENTATQIFFSREMALDPGTSSFTIFRPETLINCALEVQCNSGMWHFQRLNIAGSGLIWLTGNSWSQAAAAPWINGGSPGGQVSFSAICNQRSWGLAIEGGRGAFISESRDPASPDAALSGDLSGVGDWTASAYLYIIGNGGFIRLDGYCSGGGLDVEGAMPFIYGGCWWGGAYFNGCLPYDGGSFYSDTGYRDTIMADVDGAALSLRNSKLDVGADLDLRTSVYGIVLVDSWLGIGAALLGATHTKGGLLIHAGSKALISDGIGASCTLSKSGGTVDVTFDGVNQAISWADLEAGGRASDVDEMSMIKEVADAFARSS